MRPNHSQNKVVDKIINDFFGDTKTFSYINNYNGCTRIIPESDKKLKKSNIKHYIDITFFPSGLVDSIETQKLPHNSLYSFHEQGKLVEELHSTISNKKSYQKNSGRSTDFLYCRKYTGNGEIYFESHVDPNTGLLHNPYGPAIISGETKEYWFKGANLGQNIILPPGGITDEFIKNMNILK